MISCCQGTHSYMQSYVGAKDQLIINCCSFQLFFHLKLFYKVIFCIFFQFFFFFNFIYFWLHWVFVAMCGLSLVALSGATLCYGAQASHCNGFSCCRARALGTWASVAVARGLSSCGSWTVEHRLSSCGAWAQLLHGMWDLPRPGLEPVSPALTGGFLTTAPPGKSPFFQFERQQNCILKQNKL